MKKIFIVLIFVTTCFLGCTPKKGEFYIEPIRGNSAFLINNTQRTARFDLIAGESIGTITMWKEHSKIGQFDVYIIPLELKEDQIVEITKYRWRFILRPGDKFVVISDGLDKSLYKNYTKVEFSMVGKFFDKIEVIRVELYQTLWL
jgi:hypothetical protein